VTGAADHRRPIQIGLNRPQADAESAVVRLNNDRFLGERRGAALYDENLPSRPNQEKNQDRASDDVITGL
jgi:hypothetical protein